MPDISNEEQIGRIVSLIFTVRNLMHEKVAQEKDKKVSFLQLITLRFIKHKKPTMKEIADYLTITAPSATVLCGNLMREGAVKREEEKEDRRIIRMIITKKGEAYLKKGNAEIAKRIENNLMVLTKKEQEELTRILGKVSAHLSRK